jgi:hypothetical protein
MANEVALPCKERNQFSAHEYWFWQGYLGVEKILEKGDALQGRLSSDPTVCFEVKLRDLGDPAAHALGSKMAIEEWFNRIPLDPKAWDSDPEVAFARKRLKEITGLSFESREALKNWWVANQDYLIWSNEESRLVVSEQAKAARSPVLDVFEDIEASEYWFLAARDWISKARKEGEFLLAEAWYPPHGSKRVRVKLGSLDDRRAKEKGMQLAVRNLILDGISLPELGDEGRQEILRRLRKLTGLNFKESKEWIEWWEKNQDKLVLSKDEKHLVVNAN